ncbi:hypothetical protein LCGC14_2575930 [marine sediment metagenome]|uniref:Uncharacterized protein n=1 Tax=marine sediment metagenome TaxID=412755 RepID=A0A0F9B3S6_9ZZZZ
MIKPCLHETLLARIKIPVNEYVCDDCTEKLVLVIPQYGLMTPAEFEQFKRTQAMQMEAARRREKTGLVTPAEWQQMTTQQTDLAKKYKEAKEGKR